MKTLTCIAPVCSKGGNSLSGRRRLHGLPDTLIHWIVIYQVDSAFHPTSFGQLADASGFLSRLAFFIGKTARSM